MEDLRTQNAIVIEGAALWEERAICREIFGLLQLLSLRPFSKAHDGGLNEARTSLQGLVQSLAAIKVPRAGPGVIGALQSFSDKLGVIPPEVVARTLISPLRNLIMRDDVPNEFRCCFEAALPFADRIGHLIIAIGPTIGLGDEVLIARALIEHCRCLDRRPSLSVSTRSPDLWTCLDGGVEVLDGPPLGGLQCIGCLDPAARTAAGYLYVDFLDSDPAPSVYHGPPGIRCAGRWYMGPARGDFFDFDRDMRYVLNYPDGLPSSWWMQSRWIARQFLRGPIVSGGRGVRTAHGWPTHRRILVQALTAKPELMFPPEIFRDVAIGVHAQVTDVEWEMIPGPTPRSQGIVCSVAEALAAGLPRGAVALPAPMPLRAVFSRLAEARVLFGVDTFSAHFAAILGTPQVTISLPAHRPWITSDAPCLPVSSDWPHDRIIAACVEHIVAFLRVQHMDAALELRALGQAWRPLLEAADGVVDRYFDGDRTLSVGEAAYLIGACCDLMGWTENGLGSLVPRHLAMYPGHVSKLDLTSFDGFDDAFMSFARWCHALGLAPATNLLRAI